MLAPVRDDLLFARVVREAFATRRKMLRRSLGDAFGAEIAATALATSAIAGTRRPEELSVVEFGRLTDGLAAAVDSATSPAAVVPAGGR